MIYIALGVFGFIVLFFFDLFALKGVRAVKTLIWFAGYGLISYAINVMIRKEPRIDLPPFLRIIGIALAGLFALLLVYSLLIEIPFRRTYLQKGAGDKLVTTGTYALVRHPGVLWLVVCLIGMFLATGTKLLLVAIPVWVLMDVIYVVIQDRYYFPRQFGKAYDDYRRSVPMLIPTVKSTRRCIQTTLNKPSK